MIHRVAAVVDVRSHGEEPIGGALLAAAGPVQGGRCKLTNAVWILDEEQIATALHLP